MTAAERRFHRSYGRASNIPECCIEFWLGSWMLWTHTGRGDLRRAHDAVIEASAARIAASYQPRGARFRVRGFGYVPCPECCAADRMQAIRACPPPEPWRAPWVRTGHVSRRWTRDIRLVSIPVDRRSSADTVAA